MKFIRILSSVACAAAAIPALAGHGHNQVIKGKAVTVEGPFIQNTLEVVPQIHSEFKIHSEGPENPLPPLKWNHGDAQINNTPIGAANGPERVTKGPLFPGIGATGWVPPDPNIAAGPTALVETVNSTVAFFDKSTGRMTFEQDMTGANGFFSGIGAGSFIYDPKVMYDKLSSRFFVLALEQDTPSQTSKVLIAVSANSNPNGTWFKYRIEAKETVNGNSFWLDYPTLAASKDGIACAGNMFGFSSGWNGVQFIVLKKSDLIAGKATTATSLQDTGSASAQLARNTETAQSNIYGLALQSSASLRVYSINNPGATPTVTSTDIGIPQFSGASQSAQSVGGTQLDTIGGRIFNVYQRNGHLVTGHAVDQPSGSRARINSRWYQLGLNGWPASSSPTLLQAGQIDTGSNDDDFMPALDENLAGDVTCIFTRCSPSVVADIMIAGRKKTDKVGILSNPTILQSGKTQYGGSGENRWGDYFDVSLDPNDGLTFWGVGMTSDANGNWQTYFFNWQISKSINLPIDTNANGIAVNEGKYVSGDLTSTNALDNIDYYVGSAVQAGYGQVASAILTYNLAPASTLASVSLKLGINTSSRATQLVYLYNWKTSKYDLISTTQVNPILSAAYFPISNFTPYVSGSGQLKMLVRGAVPQRGGVANSFRLGIDLAQVETVSNQ